MLDEHAAAHWLPIRFFITPTAISVKWMDFRGAVLSEPFFHQTVRKLRKGVPPAAERTTSLAMLLEAARGLPELEPSGIIFHISRCGSTLLANALRTGNDTVVLSESAPTGLLFRAGALRYSPFPVEGRDDARRMLLNSVVGLYAHDESRRRRKIVIKCHTISILEIAAVRAIWPAVPFVVVIRNPAEVIVSNTAKPAGWVKGRRRPRYTREAFGWTDVNAQRMPIEEYCARGISQFCEMARPLVGPDCKVVDYRDLNPNNIRKIAELFGIGLPPADAASFTNAISAYSKDPVPRRTFESDQRRKQESCPPEVRESAQRWAWDEYTKLRELAAW